MAKKKKNTRMQPGVIKAKRTTKDSVFVDLFTNKKYLLELYKTLHPEDTDVTEDDLDIVTIENILTDSLYNDLGFMVHGNQLLILVEAQTTWSENILIRIFLYLAQTYLEYVIETEQDLYAWQKASMPMPELYVIYTGPRAGKPKTIKLSRDFFGVKKAFVEVEAIVIYEGRKKNIINEYINFCKVFNEQTKQYGMTQEAVEATIRICKDKDYLREYLSKREKEAMTIMMRLFDQELATELYGKRVAKEAAEEAAKEADKATAERMIRMGKYSLDEIALCVPSLTLEELREIEANTMQMV